MPKYEGYQNKPAKPVRTNPSANTGGVGSNTEGKKPANSKSTAPVMKKTKSADISKTSASGKLMKTSSNLTKPNHSITGLPKRAE